MNTALDSLNPYLLIISNFIDDAPALLQSEAAIVTYVWLGIALLLLAMLIPAAYYYQALRALRPADLIEKYRGRTPTNPESIEKRVGDMFAKAAAIKWAIAYKSFFLLLVATVVPGLCLVGIIFWEDRLLNGQNVLLIGAIPTTADQLGYLQVSLFIGDQALRGALSDFIEVFEVGLTEVSHNSSNWIFSSFLLLYRVITGLTMVAIVVAGIKVFLGQRMLKKSIKTFEPDAP